MRQREASPNIRATPIKSIKLDAKSRDDIPALLRGLQHLYIHPDLYEEVMGLLENHVTKDYDHENDRPGMTFWAMLVLGVLKDGLGCDYDHLQELANQHMTLRQMLQHPLGDDYRYSHRTIENNVDLVSPVVLKKIKEIVVREGLDVARKFAWRRVGRPR